MPRQTLKKRTDGYYRTWFHGKQLYAKTAKEAIRKQTEMRARYEMFLPENSGKVLFNDYAHARIDAYYARAGEATRKMYHSMVQYAADNLTHPRLIEITSDELQTICNALAGYSVSHVRKFMNLMRNIFKAACADGLRLTDPMNAVRALETKPVEGHRALKAWERDLVRSTWRDHDFGPAAMVMLYAGLRRGEVLYLDIDRDVDFDARTITVRGGVAFPDGNQPVVTPGKTKAAQRTIPLAAQLEEVLRERHGLLLTKEDGGMMTMVAFDRKYESYITFLEKTVIGCAKRWYGKTKAHKALLAEGKGLPPWQAVTIRCHDFRKDFCTRGCENGISQKAMQTWMGHAGPEMIAKVYMDFTDEQAAKDAEKLMNMDANEKSFDAQKVCA